MIFPRVEILKYDETNQAHLLVDVVRKGRLLFDNKLRKYTLDTFHKGKWFPHISLDTGWTQSLHLVGNEEYLVLNDEDEEVQWRLYIT